jgi:hypothetical protein
VRPSVSTALITAPRISNAPGFGASRATIMVWLPCLRRMLRDCEPCLPS